MTVSPRSGLRYLWPLFLSRGDVFQDFWSNLKQKIVETLKRAPILESQDRTAGLRRPNTLLYIPPNFKLDGLPLLERQDMKRRYLSFKYDDNISGLMPELRLLGVRSMSGDDFVEEFRNCLSEGGARFLSMHSNAWHAKVGELLQRYTSPVRLNNLAIIPLQDGEWAGRTERDIYLNHRTLNQDVPHGINIRLVDLAASSDYRRREFFRWLGITVCDEAKVCSLILELHHDERRVVNRSIPDLVADAFYLFRTPRRIFDSSLHAFRLADADSEVRYGSQLYIEHPGRSSPVARYARDPQSGMRFLHQEYFDRAEDDNNETDLARWLTTHVKVLTLPCLVRGGALTTEFKFLTTNEIVWDFLLILRDHWAHYRGQMSMSLSSSLLMRRRQLSDAISEIRILPTGRGYRGRYTCSLSRTALGLDRLRALAPHLPYINVPEPEHHGWEILSRFGVIVNETMELYLRELEALAQDNDPTTEIEVGRIYGHIARLYSTTQDRTRIRQVCSILI